MEDHLNQGPMSAPTTKRQRLQPPTRIENNSLIPLNSKKCGEVLVTNTADKWTFVCTFCKLATGDIGVFICHIKVEHLHGDEQRQGNLENVTANNTINNVSKIGNTKYAQQQQQNKFPAILEVTSLARQTRERSTNEQQLLRLSSDNIAEESILPHNTEDHPEKDANTSLLQSKEVYEVIYLNDDNNIKKSKTEENNCIMIDDDDDDEEDDVNNVINEALDNNTQYSFPNNNDEVSNDDLELIENDNEDSALVPTSSSNNTSRRSRKKKIVNDQDLPFKCTYCRKGFKSKQAIYYHHRTHEKQNQLKCPMCPVSHCTEQLFVSHVLTHESQTCFPCQVCGRALPTNEKRLEHMKSHEAERPFGCTYCFRRFRKKHFLTNHLRMHCQYLCDFCPAEFSAPQAQRRPYVCPSCENLPDIRRKVEQQRSLAAKNNTLESDQE